MTFSLPDAARNKNEAALSVISRGWGFISSSPGAPPGAIAEEMTFLGQNDHRALRSHMRVLLMHLLKWNHQPERRTRSWWVTIRNGRERARLLLGENPGLKPKMPEILTAAYKTARTMAADETGLSVGAFSVFCPFTLEQVLDEDFLPDDGRGNGHDDRP